MQTKFLVNLFFTFIITVLGTGCSTNDWVRAFTPPPVGATRVIATSNGGYQSDWDGGRNTYRYNSTTVATPRRTLWRDSQYMNGVSQSDLPDKPANHSFYTSGNGYSYGNSSESTQYGYVDANGNTIVTTDTFTQSYSETYPVCYGSVPVYDARTTAREGTVYGSPLGLQIARQAFTKKK